MVGFGSRSRGQKQPSPPRGRVSLNRRWGGRTLLVAAITVGAFRVAAAPASTSTSSVFAHHTMSGKAIPCTAQSDGVRVCHGDYNNGPSESDIRLKTFDGVPLEVYVDLPPAGTHPPYPLIVQSHGWDEPTTGPSDNQYYGPTADTWAKEGYAVLQLVARGWGDSCGTAASRAANVSACEDGYIRLDDERYEARDVQYAVGLLVDEGLVNANKIGVTGESYGGGVSLELATLNNRIMKPDGKLAPWRSPKGKPLHIAAAAPVIPWSDLAYALMPNGRTLDTKVTSPKADLSPIGVEKQSFVSGLFAEGAAGGYYAPAGTNKEADLTTWYATINAGEPYDSNPEDEYIVKQLARYHSPYYLLDGAYGTGKEAPAPLLIANGFTDDLFPVDEAVRYYNYERAHYPDDPIGLFDGDFGHEPANNKPRDKALLSSAIQRFFNHYLKGTRNKPPLGATALVETCPATVPSLGPYHASTWAGLHPHKVTYSSAAAQTILSTAGNPTIAEKIDPIAGDDACASVTATDQTGVASYRLPAASGSGYTLLGAPQVTAKLNVTPTVTGDFAYIAARLWDVDPSTNTETLVTRGLYRIDADGTQTFQLHPGAWHFASGHIAKLELLGQDPPYARISNGTFAITVSDLKLILPTH